ncbi:MAG: hypothetical protein K8S27_08890 [Candidatus Omnitrophica bacterium]|nr:hypothetical protein [Candidatus Omnitrophota bacterium]
MKKIWIMCLFVCLSMTSCNSKAEQVAARMSQADSTARMLMDELEGKLSIPMTRDRYAGYVERMGRCPDRFDYLYEAAFAHCYAVRQGNQKRKAIVQGKSKEYYRIWKDYSSKPSAERRDFYPRVSGLPVWMISRYQEILKHDPDHPFKKDLLSAIKELEEYRKKE